MIYVLETVFDSPYPIVIVATLARARLCSIFWLITNACTNLNKPAVPSRLISHQRRSASSRSRYVTVLLTNHNELIF